MKKATVIPTVSVLIALVCAALFCLNWNPEPLLKGKEQPVTLSDIEQNLTTDFNGFPAGEDIPRLTRAEQPDVKSVSRKSLHLAWICWAAISHITCWSFRIILISWHKFRRKQRRQSKRAKASHFLSVRR